jgi:hypothetical protein
MTKPAPTPMTPVDITDRAPHIRSGRVQVWGAKSRDGVWTYERTEEAGTPWVITHVSTGKSTYASSLPGARRSTASPEFLDWMMKHRPTPGGRS